MDLGIKNKTYIVCGATSGFGNAIAMQLLKEEANVIAVARNEEKLKMIQHSNVEILAGDITRSSTMEELLKIASGRKVDGILVNASGPPAKTFEETVMQDWDEAYRSLLRWKVELTKLFLPAFLENNYGRFVYIESSAVKQPIDNLILSTSLRLSVVGFVKSLSQEVSGKGVTFNVLAPGYHFTPAVDRLIVKKAEKEKISVNEARSSIEKGIPVGHAGRAEYFATLAVWLLSPMAEYVTGQVYAVDGGTIKLIL